jgi:hypothetical protein
MRKTKPKNMKKVITIVLVAIFSSTFAQKITIDPQILSLGWSFVSPLILKKVTDTLTKDIIINAIPKIIEQNPKAAALEVANAISKDKHIAVLNKDFLTLIDKNIDKSITAIKQKDYATAVNELAVIVVFTNNYIKNGTLGDSNSKNDIVTKKEVNGKVYVEKNNSYYFFIPNGNFTEQTSTDTSHVKFMLKLDNGKTFEFGIWNHTLNNDKCNVDWFQKNSEEQDNILEMLKENFGNGFPSPSSIVTFTNIKAIKYPYLASSISSMTNTYVAFHNATLFMIYFKTPQSDFTETSKSFDDLMNNFFFGKDIPFCNMKNMGILTIVNKSTNPYTIYKNGNILLTIPSKSEENIYVEMGTTLFKAEQKTGYLMYPTVNNRKVTFNAACQTLTINIGFTD